MNISSYIKYSIFLTITILAFNSNNIKYYFNNIKRVDYEEFLSNLPYYKQGNLTKKQLKKIPKHNRPKPNVDFDNIKTIDPELQRVPNERLFRALKEKELRMVQSDSRPSRDTFTWKERGPANVAGRTRATMFDPNDSDSKRFWAGGITGGLWFTNDITATSPQWNEVSGLWPNLAISSIAYDPSNKDVFYVGTGEIYPGGNTSSRGFGIWKSEDGGSSWFHLSSTQNFHYVNDLAVRLEDGVGVLYAGVGANYYEGSWHGTDGLYRSTNQGSSFSQVLPNAVSTPYQPSDIEISSDNTIWIGSRSNSYGQGKGVILKSSNGLNWDLVYQGLSSNRVEIAVSPSNPSIVYAVGKSDIYSDNDIGFFVKSTNAGSSWSNITIPLNENNVHFTRGLAWYCLTLAVHPENPSILYAGGIDLHKTTNSGSSWNQISHWYGRGGMNYVHADQHSISFRPGYIDEFAVGNDGGIHYSTDGGNSFANYANNYSYKNNGYNVTQFYSVAMHPGQNSNQFLAGTQDNGTQYFDEQELENTDQVSGGDGGWCFFNKNDPSYFITSIYYNKYKLFHNLNFSYDILNDGSTGHFINPTDFDSDNDILYATRDNSSLTRVFNVSSSPQRDDIMNLDLGSFASSIKVSPFNPSNLIIGTDAGRLFKINNANSQNPLVTEITSNGFPAGYLSSIEYGVSAQRILITFSNYGVNSIWESLDGGDSWSSLEGDLPDMPIRWAIYHPDNDNFIIAATEVGVWMCKNTSLNSIEWSPSNGVPSVRIDMLRVRESDRVVAAATHGRGLFTTSLIDVQSKIDENLLAPSNFSLGQNYPNPFNMNTKLEYNLKISGFVNVTVYDMMGKVVRNLLNERREAGNYVLSWDGSDNNRKAVPTGEYIYKINIGSFSQTKKMTLLK